MKNGRKKLIKGVNDFKTWCIHNNKLDLLNEWDAEKNMPLTPENVCYGSSKKVWWVSNKCGHSFAASLNKRTSDETGCPYCTDSHTKLLIGFNDLQTTNPELCEEWDYERNENLKPFQVMKGQHRKVWWKGKCGHHWLASPDARNRGRGCHICANESKTSFPEQCIYYYLSQVFNDVVNRDNKTINKVELDIYIPSLKIAIEYDGAAWHKNLLKDYKKNKACSQNDITLYRVREYGCPEMESDYSVKIIKCRSDKEKDLEKALNELFKGMNLVIDIDLERDRSDIFSMYIKSRKNNSLMTQYPQIAEEWDYDKNGELLPDMVVPQSPKKVWWKGKCGHSWNTSINTRVNKNSGCPYCNGRLLKGFNDIRTTNPNILKYWDFSKNKSDPSEFTATSSEKVWWHCPECGNSFKMQISYKCTNNEACPYCSHKVVCEGLSDLEHINPNLASEWDYDKNGSLTPNMVTFSSDVKVWWKCKNGHSYQSSISNRNNGRGCPICSGRKFVKGLNDFETMHPELLKEWDYDKNEKMPSEYPFRVRELVWWKDTKGHSWQQTIEHRHYGHGCPYCNGTAKKRVLNVDTNQIFNSLTDAAKSCGLPQGDTISLCCRGKQKTAGGYHWKYID